MGSRQVSFFKRRFTRARIGATAFVLGRLDGSAERVSVDEEQVECLGPLVVENLSAGGALLLGGSGWRVGQTVELELKLRRRAPIRAHAVIVRVEAHKNPIGVAVEFQDLPQAVEESIHEAVRAAIERSQAAGRKVVVVTPHEEDILLLGLSIASLGLEPIVVSTVLEGLRWLQDPHVAVSGLMIDSAADGDTGVDALAWCADAFPGVRCVMIVREGELQQRTRDPRLRAAGAIVRRPVGLRRIASGLGVRVPHEMRAERQTDHWIEAYLNSERSTQPALSTIPVPGW